MPIEGEFLLICPDCTNCGVSFRSIRPVGLGYRCRYCDFWAPLPYVLEDRLPLARLQIENPGVPI
jgi:hypothetical protein